MSLKYTEKTICTIKISGLQDEWKYWLRKFLTRARKRSYRQILDGTSTIPTKLIYDQAKLADLMRDDQKEAIKNYYLALLAYEDLLLSMCIKSNFSCLVFYIHQKN